MRLSYVAQAAVQNYGWLAPGEMLDGLGMAETTPGPLIQVVQFVGFMGAFREAAPLDPWLAVTLAAILTTWVTFVLCFLWIFIGAPYVERLRDNAALSGAMTAITAAVVGVVLNLAVWFGLHVAALVLSVAALLAIFRFGVGMLKVLGACALARRAAVAVVIADWRRQAVSTSRSKAAALGQKARHSSIPASRRMAPQQWPATGQALQLPRRLG
ncbi:chromate transporter [Billgrantia zhangzhouensis]|nr:chromate transporter [Halomonas zhangzhouensis]